MSFWNNVNNFFTKCEEISSNLNQKASKMLDDTEKYVEKERVNDFYKIKAELVEINKKQKAAGLKETTVYDFFKDRPEYADLLELERNKNN